MAKTNAIELFSKQKANLPAINSSVNKRVAYYIRNMALKNKVTPYNTGRLENSYLVMKKTNVKWQIYSPIDYSIYVWPIGGRKENPKHAYWFNHMVVTHKSEISTYISKVIASNMGSKYAKS